MGRNSLCDNELQRFAVDFVLGDCYDHVLMSAIRRWGEKAGYEIRHSDESHRLSGYDLPVIAGRVNELPE